MELKKGKREGEEYEGEEIEERKINSAVNKGIEIENITREEGDKRKSQIRCETLKWVEKKGKGLKEA